MGHKEALLVAARQCVEEIGYGRTTARDLVAASNTNLASIGYHYGSKEALLNTAIAEAFYEWTEQAVKVALDAPGASPLERVVAGWELILNSFPEHRGLLMSFVEASAQAQHRPELQRIFEEQYQTSRRRIADEIRRELNIEDETSRVPEVVSSFAIAVCDGFALQWLCDPEGAPSGTEVVEGLRAAVAFFLAPTATKAPDLAARAVAVDSSA